MYNQDMIPITISGTPGADDRSIMDREEKNNEFVMPSVTLIASPSRQVSTHATSHHTQYYSYSPRRTRHYRLSKQPKQYHHLAFSFLLLICFLSHSVSAGLIKLWDERLIEDYEDPHSNHNDISSVQSHSASEGVLIASSLDRLARSGTILVDQRPQPVPLNPKAWVLASIDDDLPRLHRRHETSETSTSSASSKTTKTTSLSTQTTSTLAGTTTSSSSAIAAATQTATALPTPFDSGFSANVTESCAKFVNGFLDNSTFKTCLPISLLLQSSNSFFQIEKSLVRVTETLDYTCAANVTACTEYTTLLANNLTSADNCGSDIANQNPLVEQALLGLRAYETVYLATCLRDPANSAYCFAEAVTNTSSPTDSYAYYLPLDIALPGGSDPTCDVCLQNTMAVFQAATSNRSTAIASTYADAAEMIDVLCGPGFINASLAAAEVTSGVNPSLSPPVFGQVGLLTLIWCVGSWLL